MRSSVLTCLYVHRNQETRRVLCANFIRTKKVRPFSRLLHTVSLFFLLLTILGKHVVFGRVESGMAVVKKLGMTPTDSGDRPKYDVQIASCGQVGLGGTIEGAGASGVGVGTSEGGGAEGSAGGQEGQEGGNQDGGGDAKVEEEENEEEYDEAAEAAANEEAMSEMTEKQKRLFKLRMSINKVMFS